MFSFNSAFAQTAFDPTTIGVGARALGMGKAYAAMAEEGDIIFTNPAGLGEIDSFQFTSMSGKIMEDINYSMLGGVFPLGERGALGIGFVSARILGIEIRDSYGDLQTISNFENSLVFASFGKKINEKLSFGLNFKYYYQDGSEVNAGDGTGVNLDVGILQSGLNWLSLGVVGKNLLSSNKIVYKNGAEESFSPSIKFGSKFYLLGEHFSAARLAPVELILLLDADFNLDGTLPAAYHMGIELTPVANLSLRAGIDQNPKPGGIETSRTLGVSLRYAGIAFHYAYHPYTEFEYGTHFFSLNFDEHGWPFEGLPDIFFGKSPSPSFLQKS